MSNLQLTELKSATKNATGLTLKSSLNMIRNSNDKTNFLSKLVITDREVSKLCKAFANNSSANEKLLKTQISKIKQSGGFLGKFLKPLMKICFLLMKNVLTHTCKKFSRTIRINNSSISNICSFWKENFQIWNDNVVNSNEKTEDTMKVVKSLDDSDILIKGVTKAI